MGYVLYYIAKFTISLRFGWHRLLSSILCFCAKKPHLWLFSLEYFIVVWCGYLCFVLQSLFLFLIFVSYYMHFEVWHWYFFYVPGFSGNLGRGSPHSGPFQVRLFSVFKYSIICLSAGPFRVHSGPFQVHSGPFRVQHLATCGKSVSKLYILYQIWLSLTSAFPNNTSYGWETTVRFWGKCLLCLAHLHRAAAMGPMVTLAYPNARSYQFMNMNSAKS